MLLRLVLLFLTAGLVVAMTTGLVGGVRGGGHHHAAHDLSGGGSDAASPPEAAPDLDTGGELALPAPALAEPAHAPRSAPPPAAAAPAVGRLHAVRLFRPPRTSTRS